MKSPSVGAVVVVGAAHADDRACRRSCAITHRPDVVEQVEDRRQRVLLIVDLRNAPGQPGAADHVWVRVALGLVSVDLPIDQDVRDARRAFVDIGVKQDGLLHKRAMPQGTALQVGDVIVVSVLAVDKERGRISLGWADGQA